MFLNKRMNKYYGLPVRPAVSEVTKLLNDAPSLSLYIFPDASEQTWGKDY